MSGRPKCPNCGYEDPAFGSTNDRVNCGNCGQMYEPEPKFRRVGVIVHRTNGGNTSSSRSTQANHQKGKPGASQRTPPPTGKTGSWKNDD